MRDERVCSEFILHENEKLELKTHTMLHSKLCVSKSFLGLLVENG